MESDLELAFVLADAADEATMRLWNPTGVSAEAKPDGTLVTAADLAAETAVQARLQVARASDGLLGEEIGEHPSTNGRRWIVDGIDWTRSYAAGEPTWGTLIALEVDGDVVLGLASSPAQDRRWWATRGHGAFTTKTDGSEPTRMQVSDPTTIDPARVATLPRYAALSTTQQRALDNVCATPPQDWPWCHQMRVAEGELDICIWFGGDIWDHAAPSIIVEEAGGRFTDHFGGKRLDTRTALYTNGAHHDAILRLLSQAMVE